MSNSPVMAHFPHFIKVGEFLADSKVKTYKEKVLGLNLPANWAFVCSV